MAKDATCKSKENIDRAAKEAMDHIEKLVKAQTPPQELQLGLQEVKNRLQNITMDNHGGGEYAHGGGPGEFAHGG